MGLKNKIMKIGLLGIGLMGLPMAQRLLEAGFSLCVYNRTVAKVEPLRTLGAVVAATPDQVLQQSDCVILMLTNAAAIRETVLAPESRSQLAGKTILQMGTIAPSESRELEAEVLSLGGDYLEAPVLGSIPEAKTGSLIVMVGGTPEQMQTYSSILHCFGKNPLLMGAVGTAAAVKLALNQLIGGLTATFATSLGFVLQQGASVDLFMQILRDSALYAPTFDKKLQRMCDRNYSNPNFPTKHLLKDANLFLDEAKTLHLNAQIVEATAAILAQTIALKLADADYSALFSAVSPD